MKPLLPPLMLLAALGGCAIGNREVESVHQPIVDDHTAYVPGCPVWADTTGGERESQSSNFGCATNSNLAAMVADPVDLLHGRSEGTSADVSYRAIKLWRETIPSGKGWQTTATQSAPGAK